MIPRHIHPSWYRIYWFDSLDEPTQPGWPPAHARTGRAYRLHPALLAIVLLSAALVIGAVLSNAPTLLAPADLLYVLS